MTGTSGTRRIHVLVPEEVRRLAGDLTPYLNTEAGRLHAMLRLCTHPSVQRALRWAARVDSGDEGSQP